MQKILFIDRDGTLIVEPADFQIDSFEKLTFYPDVITTLSRISQDFDYRLVMVSNQDGLGTDSFPSRDFIGPHELLLRTLAGEGIEFDEILIDRSKPEDQAPTRKPATGLVQHYLNSDQYDLANSIVIGDRPSDIQFAQNIGCKAIYLSDNMDERAVLSTASWSDVYKYLQRESRYAIYAHKTNETDVTVQLYLDGSGQSQIATGIAFFDHMLEQLAKHGGLDLSIQTEGDLEVDEHHTIEDTALALGYAFSEALGSKKGISRYGFLLPMDEALAQVAVDFGGRPYFIWDAEFKREKIGEMPTEMFKHFFKSFSDSAKCTLHIAVSGENEHHKIEAIFKAFAKAIKMAVRKNPDDRSVPSTKGSI